MRSTGMKEILYKLTNKEHYTIFVVGDSITEGFRATNKEYTYTACFARGLAARFPDRTVTRYDGKRYNTPDAELLPLERYSEPISVQRGNGNSITVVRSGIGGNTVQRLLNRQNDFIGKSLGGHTADLFIVMVGINDAIESNPSKYAPPAVYLENLRTLVALIQDKHPDADLILMTPTYNDDGLTPTSHLEPYADAMRTLCREQSIPLIDQHRIWMEHQVVGGENFGQGSWLSGLRGDACHPSDVGHAAIADAILQALFE